MAGLEPTLRSDNEVTILERFITEQKIKTMFTCATGLHYISIDFGASERNRTCVARLSVACSTIELQRHEIY